MKPYKHLIRLVVCVLFLLTPSTQATTVSTPGLKNVMGLGQVHKEGPTELRVSLATMVYQHGSFRQISSIHGGSVYLIKGVRNCNTILSNRRLTISTDPSTPTNQITYHFSGKILVKVPKSLEKSLEQELAHSNFTRYKASGTVVYYIKYFDQPGQYIMK